MKFLYKKAAAIAVLAVSTVFANADVAPNQPRPTHPEINISPRNRQHVVWWMQDNTLVASVKRNQSDRDILSQAVKSYIVIGVIDSDLSVTGMPVLKNYMSMRATLRLVDATGHTYMPLEEMGVNVDVLKAVEDIRTELGLYGPVLTREIQFYIFPRTGADGQAIVSPTGDGDFHVQSNGEDFAFHMPLAMAVPVQN